MSEAAGWNSNLRLLPGDQSCDNGGPGEGGADEEMQDQSEPKHGGLLGVFGVCLEGSAGGDAGL